MADDQVRIDVQVTGQPIVDRLKQSIVELEKQVEKLDQEFAQGKGDAASYTAEMGKLTAQIGRQTAAMEHAAARAGGVAGGGVAGGGAGAAGAAMDALHDKTRRAGQGVLDIGRAFQDLAQGGVGAILNNLEGLGRATTALKGVGLVELLSSPAGIAGAMTAVGTAAYIAWPHISKMWEELTTPAKVKVPATTDAVQGLTEAFNRQKKAVQDLREQGMLYAYQIDELKRLEGELKDTEVKLEAARKARSVGEFESGEFKDRAAMFTKAVQEFGGSQKVLDVLTQSGMKLRTAEQVLAGALTGGELSIRKVTDIMERSKNAFQYTDMVIKKQDEALEKFLDARAKEADLLTAAARQAAEHHRKARAELQHEQTEAALARNALAIKAQQEAEAAGRDRFGKAFDVAGRAGVQGMVARMQQEQAMFGRAMPFGEEELAEAAAGRQQARRARRRAAEAAVGARVGAAPTGAQLGVGGGAAAAAMRAPQVQRAMLDNQRAMTENLQAMAGLVQGAIAVGAANRRLNGRLQKGGEQPPGPSGLER